MSYTCPHCPGQQRFIRTDTEERRVTWVLDAFEDYVEEVESMMVDTLEEGTEVYCDNCGRNIFEEGDEEE